MVTFETVRGLLLALPEVTEGIAHGTPAFYVRKKFFSRLREEDVLVVKCDLGYVDALIQLEPDTYFSTPHYAGYPYVLVRLSRADEAALRDLLTDGWRLSAPKRLVASFDAARTARML